MNEHDSMYTPLGTPPPGPCLLHLFKKFQRATLKLEKTSHSKIIWQYLERMHLVRKVPKWVEVAGKFFPEEEKQGAVDIKGCRVVKQSKASGARPSGYRACLWFANYLTSEGVS